MVELSIDPALAAAIVAAQGQIEGAKKGKKNEHFRAKYADLASVWDACREALQANGLAVVQLPVEAPTGFIGLATTIIHSSGAYIGDKFFMPLKDATNPQAAGSALTYARRYALAAAIGICPEDDDGNAAAAPQKAFTAPTQPAAPPKQWEKLFAKLETTEEKKELFAELRASKHPEPERTNLLKAWSNELTAAKAAIAANGK